MRSAAAGLAVALLVGLGILLWRSLEGEELDAVRPGVAAAGPVATLEPGRELCQRPIDLDRPAPRLGLALYNGPRPGPAVRVRIADVNSGQVLRTLTLPPGWTLPAGQYYGLKLPAPLPGDRAIEVCARNDGKHAIELYGKDAISASNLYEGDKRVGGDWGIYFPLLPDERRSYFQMIPDFLRRASILRPGIVGPATYAVLAILLLIGAPFSLYRAVTRAAEEEEED